MPFIDDAEIDRLRYLEAQEAISRNSELGWPRIRQVYFIAEHRRRLHEQGIRERHTEGEGSLSRRLYRVQELLPDAEHIEAVLTNRPLEPGEIDIIRYLDWAACHFTAVRLSDTNGNVPHPVPHEGAIHNQLSSQSNQEVEPQMPATGPSNREGFGMGPQLREGELTSASITTSAIIREATAWGNSLPAASSITDEEVRQARALLESGPLGLRLYLEDYEIREVIRLRLPCWPPSRTNFQERAFLQIAHFELVSDGIHRSLWGLAADAYRSNRRAEMMEEYRRYPRSLRERDEQLFSENSSARVEPSEPHTSTRFQSMPLAHHRLQTAITFGSNNPYAQLINDQAVITPQTSYSTAPAPYSVHRNMPSGSVAADGPHLGSPINLAGPVLNRGPEQPIQSSVNMQEHMRQMTESIRPERLHRQQEGPPPPTSTADEPPSHSPAQSPHSVLTRGPPSSDDLRYINTRLEIIQLEQDERSPPRTSTTDSRSTALVTPDPQAVRRPERENSVRHEGAVRQQEQNLEHSLEQSSEHEEPK